MKEEDAQGDLDGKRVDEPPISVPANGERGH